MEIIAASVIGTVIGILMREILEWTKYWDGKDEM